MSVEADVSRCGPGGLENHSLLRSLARRRGSSRWAGGHFANGIRRSNSFAMSYRANHERSIVESRQ